MGTFERIRQISPYFFGVFAILLIAYFVFTSGGEDIARQNANPQTAIIGSVNGEDILRMRFDQLVRERVEQRRNQQEQDENIVIDEAQIRRQVWNELVDKILIGQYAEKAGIFVSDDELRDLLMESPPEALARYFVDSSGNFNKHLYLDVITNPDNLINKNYLSPNMTMEQKQAAVDEWRNNLIMLSELIREQKLKTALTTLVNSSEIIISPEFAKEMYRDEKSAADVEYIFFNIREIPDEGIQISESEIKDYYNKYKKYYKQKPQRKIKYVNFPIVPSKEDSAKAAKKIVRITEELSKDTTISKRDSIFDRLIDIYNGITIEYTLVKDLEPNKMSILLGLKDREVTGPLELADETYFIRRDGHREGEQEVIQASHILISFNDNKDSAKTVANELFKLAREGEDFAKLARENSQDRGSASKGGDLGYFGRGRMLKPFEEAAFAAEIGEVTGPVESQFGFHIIKVFDKKSEEISYSEIRIATKISTITKNLLKREAISFLQQVEDGVLFDTLANRLGKTAVETAFFEKTRPVLGSRYLADLAFENSEGTVLEPIELEHFGLVVVQVTDERHAGIKPLEDIRNEIIKRLKIIKKLDALKTKAEDVYKKISSAGSLSDAVNIIPSLEIKSAADIKNNGMVPGMGQEFAFTTQAFIAPLNKISKPLRGERGYYIMQVLSRHVPDENTVNNALPEYIKQLSDNSKKSEYYVWFSKIKQEADIVDLRGRYYRDY